MDRDWVGGLQSVCHNSLCSTPAFFHACMYTWPLRVSVKPESGKFVCVCVCLCYQQLLLSPWSGWESRGYGLCYAVLFAPARLIIPLGYHCGLFVMTGGVVTSMAVVTDWNCRVTA